MAQAQLSFHGHRDAVKFFVAVPGEGETMLENDYCTGYFKDIFTCCLFYIHNCLCIKKYNPSAKFPVLFGSRVSSRFIVAFIISTTDYG